MSDVTWEETLDRTCESDGCYESVDAGDQHYCPECLLWRCHVCGDVIDDVYSQGRENLCRHCRDNVVAACLCCSKHGRQITWDEESLQNECTFLGAQENWSIWQCGCCGRNMYVHHDRDGNIMTLHARGKELDRMAKFYDAM